MMLFIRPGRLRYDLATGYLASYARRGPGASGDCCANDLAEPIAE
jgi:hypothetical protein